MATMGSSSRTATIAGADRSYPLAFTVMTTVFFMWGFITCMNDILIPHLKGLFDLNYTQAMLIQFCFFGAYFVCSVPAGRIVHRIGYKRGVIVGLMIAGVGALMFYPAAEFAQYWLFLAALFVLASGITLLQVAANPYVVALGPEQTSASRLNLAQAFNSLGTTVAPLIGSALILSAVAGAADPVAEANAVKGPYIVLALALFAIAIGLAFMKLPAMMEVVEEEGVSSASTLADALSFRHLMLGTIAIFVYVGGEVSIGSFLVNFLGESDVAGLSEAKAGQYVAFYWGGAMVGRFIGSALMTRVSPGLLLAIHAALAVLLVATAATASGTLAMYSILAVGLCNSIMFPTIFTLALQGLGRHTSAGSGALCLAIVGGALVPLLQGALADAVNLRVAFVVPLLCYVYICWYGFIGSRPVDSSRG